MQQICGWRASVRGVVRGKQSNFVSHGCGSVLRASARAMDVRMSGEAHLIIRFVMQNIAGMFLWRVARTCPGAPVAAIGMLSVAAGNGGEHAVRPHSAKGGPATA